MTTEQKKIVITEREHEQIRLLSDIELYPQAVTLMQGIARPLPSTQINGLLNVSLASTYDQLETFVKHQLERKTWRREDQHIPDFYKKFSQKLKQLEAYVPAIAKLRQEEASREHLQALKMELAKEFIQHLLAENGYMVTTRPAATAGPMGNTNTRIPPQQGRPQDDNRGNRGPTPRQGRG